MNYIVLFALLAASVLVNGQSQFYSISPVVGSGAGSSYSLTGEGRITGIRLWESYYIYGIQFRYGLIWSRVVGQRSGRQQEIELFDDETIIQISGKYSYYLHSVTFVTSRGRMLQGGHPSGTSFNMYPAYAEAELRFISGRYRGPLTSIGAHWALVKSNSRST